MKNHFLMLKQKFVGKHMKTKFKDYFDAGHLIDSCAILPSISYNWMRTTDGKVYEITFTWIFWYVSFGNVRITLKKMGY